ncbi:hypothetical protein MTP99_013953 [Tenebrio molitor]|jgi:hypothetical protein|nr:hypothetical protein MTP99_013953 [Tenebrio molitor]
MIMYLVEGAVVMVSGGKRGSCGKRDSALLLYDVRQSVPNLVAGVIEPASSAWSVSQLSSVRKLHCAFSAGNERHAGRIQIPAPRQPMGRTPSLTAPASCWENGGGVSYANSLFCQILFSQNVMCHSLINTIAHAWQISPGLKRQKYGKICQSKSAKP